MRIGIHVRVGGGLDASVRKAAEIGSETIQIFASNPSAWRSAEINPQKAEIFRRLVAEEDLRPVVIHTPYLLNLASPDVENHEKSVAALVDAMQRAEVMGASYVVTHIGSHRGTSVETGIAKVREAVSDVLDRQRWSAMLLLENSAGSGNSVGSSFEDIRDILQFLEGYRGRLGICLDTAHLWGAGYDISNAVSVDETMGRFVSMVGAEPLKLMHMNDTRVPLGAHRDRHANIGTGNIGEEGFHALLHHPLLEPLPGIIETPARSIEDDLHDVDILKALRSA